MTDVKKVAVVTGSAAGLGKAIATRLANDGFRVVLHDINADNLNKVKAEFDAAGFENIAVKGNSASREDQFRLVDEAVKAFGRVDVFVNNAGVESVGTFLSLNENEIDRVLGINIKGVIFGTQAAAEQMKKQQGVGKIINACSIAGHESYEMLSLYCATKHAVRSFTHSTAKELAPYNIRVNAYCPGVADTRNRRGTNLPKASSPAGRNSRKTWPTWYPSWLRKTPTTSPAKPSSPTAAWYSVKQQANGRRQPAVFMAAHILHPLNSVKPAPCRPNFATLRPLSHEHKEKSWL